MALRDAKYQKWSYSSVPRGFALVAQLKQIKSDATPRPDPERFSADPPSFRDLTFVEFLAALAKAPPGYYRVIVFIVTDVSWSQSGEELTKGKAKELLAFGVNQLPESIGLLIFERNYTTTALIYEFKKDSQKDLATFVPNSDQSGKTHLEKAGIWDPLTR